MISSSSDPTQKVLGEFVKALEEEKKHLDFEERKGTLGGRVINRLRKEIESVIQFFTGKIERTERTKEEVYARMAKEVRQLKQFVEHQAKSTDPKDPESVHKDLTLRREIRKMTTILDKAMAKAYKLEGLQFSPAYKEFHHSVTSLILNNQREIERDRAIHKEQWVVKRAGQDALMKVCESGLNIVNYDEDRVMGHSSWPDDRLKELAYQNTWRFSSDSAEEAIRLINTWYTTDSGRSSNYERRDRVALEGLITRLRTAVSEMKKVIPNS